MMNGEPDSETEYTVETVARITGVSVQSIQQYVECGLIPSRGTFDDESLCLLRRIEQLRIRYDMNEAALRLMLHLMDEVEQLRRDLRARR